MKPQNAVFEKFQTRRFAVYSLGFFRPKLWRMLREIGITLVPFGLGRADAVLVWGRRPVAKRGMRAASRRDLPVISVEDAFIRSVNPGWGEAPLGLIFDTQSIYYDANSANDFVDHIGREQDINVALVRKLIDRQIQAGISKYNAAPRGNWPHRDYVLVIDQTYGDASITHGGAGEENFTSMLNAAKFDYPEAQIVIRGHPAGKGYFSPDNAEGRVVYSTEPANTWDVLQNASEVYVVTSQMGFEAIMAGLRPHVFGKPFYAGWGVTHDVNPIARERGVCVEELYQAAMNEIPIWFDAAGRPCDFETALDGFEAKLRHHRGYARSVFLRNIRAWKRPHLRHFFLKQTSREQGIAWGERVNPTDWILEDGFLRSRGLGAKLVPPLSLVVDKQGIYYDPTCASDLEGLVCVRKGQDSARALRLIEQITSLGLSKYNLADGEPPKVPKDCEIILVPGQVQDDRSIQLGATGDVKTTDDLLHAVRRDYPNAYVIYKPHPDVVSGLRCGVRETDLADMVYQGAGLNALWPLIDRVATITSQTGFEALIRGIKVTNYGMPFYGDWGLTDDRAPSTKRRGMATLAELVHAVLIDYPLYFDPIARRISTAEIIVERLSKNEVGYPLYLRVLTKLQQWAGRAINKFTG